MKYTPEEKNLLKSLFGLLVALLFWCGLMLLEMSWNTKEDNARVRNSRSKTNNEDEIDEEDDYTVHHLQLTF